MMTMFHLAAPFYTWPALTGPHSGLPNPGKRFFILKLLSFYNLVLTHAKLQHMLLIPHMLINIH